MVKTTSKKTSAKKTTVASKASKSAGKAKTVNDIRASKYINHGNIVSICVLVSCLTAVFVTLVFNFGMKILLAKDANDTANAKNEIASSYVEAYKSEINDVKFDANNFRAISSRAALGLIESDASGFIYIEPVDCNDTCREFRDLLSYTQSQKNDPVFAVYLGAELSDADKYLLNIYKISVNDLPTLSYIKEGVIYDRLDNISSLDNLRNFIQKYRAN